MVCSIRTCLLFLMHLPMRSPWRMHTGDSDMGLTDHTRDSDTGLTDHTRDSDRGLTDIQRILTGI